MPRMAVKQNEDQKKRQREKEERGCHAYVESLAAGQANIKPDTAFALGLVV